ncbi:putative variant erythrocyte surface antigen-1, partial [Babesia divergens]
MVCYMYYTDVFVGTDNINKLNNALKAVLEDFKDNSNDLTQLVQGLCLFMGYPSCLCSLKVNVNESLKDIFKKLIQDFEAVQSCVSIPKLDLNCSCNSKEILCKCCVISCIKELREKSQCSCLSNTSKECECKEPKETCCKDVLSGLEACLSLLNLKTDLEDCNCNGDTCCENGKCNNKCPVCVSKNFSEFAMTGLGICPMNPRKLAEKLEKFFGTGSSKSSSVCTCTCGTSKPSCCCLACQSCSSKNCSCGSNCSCDKALKAQGCPRKVFCSKINSIQVASNSSEMTCCSGGSKCHCQVDKTCTSGQNCCVVTSGGHSYHSLKCLIRRLVKFFKDLSLDSSQSGCSKLCCELLCVLKTCEFLKTLFNASKSWAGKKCSKCKGGGGKGKNCTQGTGKGSKCCGGNPSACKSGNCLGCQDCDAIKFRKALQTLRLAGPCGQDLWRVLNDFLDYCLNVFRPFIKSVKDKINAAKTKCISGCSQKTGKPCSCSNCLGCQEIRAHKDIMAILRHGYVSSYVNSTWESLCPKSSSSKCCCGLSSCSCQSSSPCCKSPSSCDPSKCCPDCPQRKAAKIFLGILPCIYYALQYLYDKSKGGWKDLLISNKDHSLGRFFAGMGFDLAKLQGKKGGEIFGPLSSLFTGSSNGPLEKLYEKSQKYFTSLSSHVPSPDSPSQPKTVRDILLWLSGLPFASGFKALLKHCKGLCESIKDSKNSVKFDNFKASLYASCLRSPF